MHNYDVIVIGSGIGGRSAAIEAQKHRLSVAVFDYLKTAQFGNSWLVGGTSINSGDIPIKLFYKASLFHNSWREASKLGVTCHRNGQIFKWVPFMNSVQLFCKTLALNCQTLFHDSGINFHNGYVCFLDKNTIQSTVSGMIKTKFRAQTFILATGTQPLVPTDIFGHDLAITSNDIFSMRKCPARVLIVGCTSTSVECAGFLHLVGVAVTIVVDAQPLINLDEECAFRILEHLDLLGVKFLWKYKVERIEEIADRIDIRTRSSLGSQVDHLQSNLKNYFSVKRSLRDYNTSHGRRSSLRNQIKFTQFNYRLRKVLLRKMSIKEERVSFQDVWWTHNDSSGFTATLNSRIHRIKQKMLPIIIETYEVVMFAQGRVANLHDMGLNDLEVSIDSEGKVISDNHDRTSCKTIYAIGDVVSGRPGLSSVAAKSGKLLIGRLYNDSTEVMNYDFVPRAILTPVKYSYVGLSEEQAIKIYSSEKVEIYERSFRPLNWKILKTNKNLICFAKMVCVEDSMGRDRVVGLHYIGPQADDVIQGFELVLKLGVDRKTINDMITVYPSDALIFTRLAAKSSQSS